MPYAIIVDFEATCSDKDEFPREEMEIIEIGAVLVDSTYNVIAEFSAFVRPQINPNLTAFCTQLTGIVQSDVDSAKTFPEVLAEWESWIQKENPTEWGSWGRYDFNQLHKDCERWGVPNPFRGIPHINLKFGGMGLKKALKSVGLPFVGNHHRGIDDAKNVARIYQRLTTEQLPNHSNVGRS